MTPTSLRSTLAAVMLGLSLTGAAAEAQPAAPPSGPQTTAVTIRPDDGRQRFEGWGASMAWWANRVGAWSDESLDEMLRLATDPEDGLGLTIFRYNIGGGENPDHDHMWSWADIPGFQPTPEGPYDWSADAAQRRVLLRLNEMIDEPIFEAFSNSPPWWMTHSGCASGSEDGGPNLREDMERAFADYLTEVVRHYHETTDVRFRTLEPFNEPMANWWRAGGRQEGCAVPVPQQRRVIAEVHDALEAKGLLDEVGIAAPDTSHLNSTVRVIRGYDDATLARLEQFNTHTYGGHDRRAELRSLVEPTGLRFWQSESGPIGNVPDSAWGRSMVMAERIVGDLNIMRPTAWLTWQVFDRTHGWSYFVWGEEGDERVVPVKKFHMMRCFTRYIRPGDRVLRSDAPESVLLAESPDGRRITAVVVNRSDASRDVHLGLETADPPTRVVVRRTSEDEDFVSLDPPAGDPAATTLTAPPQSVTTVVFQW